MVFFLEECKNQNIDVTGSEADEEQFEKLKIRFSNIIKISLPFKENFNEFNKFDYIVFNDVFEHNLKRIVCSPKFLIIIF